MRIRKLMRWAFLISSMSVASMSAVCIAQSTPPAQAATSPVTVDDSVRIEPDFTPPKISLSGQRSPCPKIAGKVTVELFISASGEASDIRVVQSPNVELGACVLEILRTATFSAATRDGKPFAFKMSLTLNMKIEPIQGSEP
jgi:TonB family protein